MIKSEKMVVQYLEINIENGLYNIKPEPYIEDFPIDVKVLLPYVDECNSIEELGDAILEEDAEIVVFKSNADIRNLIASLIGYINCNEKKFKYVMLVDANIVEENRYIVGKDSIHVINEITNIESIDFDSDYGEVLKSQKQIFQQSAKCNRVLRNGYNAFVTGIYPDGIGTSLAKHIKLDSGGISKKLEEILDINGAVLIDDLDSDIYKIRTFHHIHSLNDKEVKFDQEHSMLRKKIITYKEYVLLRNSNGFDRNILYLIKIEDIKDMEEFAKDIDFYRKNGKIDAVNSLIVDECRWTMQCTAKRLYRYTITDKGIKPCHTSERILSDNDADHYEMLVEANRVADQVIAERKCLNCPRVNSCAKCSFLPERIAGDVYCDFIKKNADILDDYMIKRRFSSMLQEISKAFDFNTTIEISSNIRGLEYESQNNEIKPSRFAFIFKNNEEYFCLRMKNWGIIKLDPKYVFLIEAWLRGQDESDDLEKQFSQKYHIDNVGTMIEEGYSRLRQGGII